MNAGFTSMSQARALILPPSLRERTDWDEQLAALGLAVVEMMEGYCARFFEFKEDSYLTEGNCLVVCVPRYPVTEWTAIEFQSEPGGTWEDISGQVHRFEDAAGIAHFRSPPSMLSGGTLRVRYQGGFWFDTTEDRSGTKPTGVKALPAVLLTAWQLQVQAIAQAQDMFGMQAGQAQTKGKENAMLPQAQLIPVVETKLKPFRRFAA